MRLATFSSARHGSDCRNLPEETNLTISDGNSTEKDSALDRRLRCFSCVPLRRGEAQCHRILSAKELSPLQVVVNRGREDEGQNHRTKEPSDYRNGQRLEHLRASPNREGQR